VTHLVGPSNSDELPEIAAVLQDPAASSWLKTCLSSAMSCDPVDAANEAEVLFLLLERRCRDTLSGRRARVNPIL
jgi:hypothetical protein